MTIQLPAETGALKAPIITSINSSLARAINDPGVVPFTWTPAEEASIVDYWLWNDLTKLKQNSDGTGAVVSAGDPVGYWLGQLSVVPIAQANAPEKAEYTAGGILLDGNGTVHGLYNNSYYHDQRRPFTVAISVNRSTSGTVGIGWGYNSGTPVWDGLIENGDNGAVVNGRVRLQSVDAGYAASFNAPYKAILCYGGSSAHGFGDDSCYAYVDGVKVNNLSIGSFDYILTSFRIRGHATNATTVRRAFVCSDKISDATAALATTWLGL